MRVSLDMGGPHKTASVTNPTKGTDQTQYVHGHAALVRAHERVPQRNPQTAPHLLVKSKDMCTGIRLQCVQS